MTRNEELESDAKTMQGWAARPHHACERGDRATQRTPVFAVLRGLEGDVIAEPFRLLVRVRVASDADENAV
jgi:hypothetical protein